MVMMDYKKLSYLLVGALVGVLASVATVFVLFGDDMNALQTKAMEADQLALDTQQYKLEIEAMQRDLQILKNEVQEKKALEEKLEKIEEYIDFDAYTEEQLNKAKDISMGTPLDFKTSLVLVDYAERFDLSPSLILGIMELESNFNQFEVGAAQDRGYMQIIPPTERWLTKAFAQELGFEYDPERIFEPEYNIGLAAVYLHTLQGAYGSNYHRILSEYNRGPYNLARYYEKNKTYSTSYSRVVLSKEKKYLAYNE